MSSKYLGATDGLHFEEVDIVLALRSVASQENNDEIEHDLMQAASDYIEVLRAEIACLKAK
jgi:hypothetical protein